MKKIIKTLNVNLTSDWQAIEVESSDFINEYIAVSSTGQPFEIRQTFDPETATFPINSELGTMPLQAIHTRDSIGNPTALFYARGAGVKLCVLLLLA